jgi:hypothetical protein
VEDVFGILRQGLFLLVFGSTPQEHKIRDDPVIHVLSSPFANSSPDGGGEMVQPQLRWLFLYFD